MNMVLWCLVINADYHLIGAFCLDVLQYWTIHYGPNSWVVMFSCMGVQSRGTPTFLCTIFNH